MRVVFLYYRDNSSPEASWNSQVLTTNLYATRIKEEGYFFLLKRMVETGIIDEVLIFIESSRDFGYIKYTDKIYGYVMPDIKNLVKDYIKPCDIIFVRGGFKTWYTSLVELQEKNHWMLLYAANTGREKWTFWDVVFNDLTGNNTTDNRGRFQFDFKKPINPNIFYPRFVEPDFDLCIGASYIHDKKGQWKTVEALVEYKKIFGKNLKCIMPGSFRRSTQTLKMIDVLKSGIINVTLPSMISRSQLNKIYNQSKLFVHLGGGGQGDRGPLEAMRCGTSVIVGNTTRHSKIVYQNKNINVVIPENATAQEVAKIFHHLNKTYSKKLKKKVYDYYEENAGIERIILPEMAKLFNFFRKYSNRNTSALLNTFN